MKYLNKLKKELENLDVYFVGCSETEIKTIQDKLIPEKKFPECYKEFLSDMGKDMDRKEGNDRGYLVGNSVFISDLESNNSTDGLKGLLLEDESSLEITGNDFVFYGSQGFLYAFFKLDEGDNPPVYAYEEGFEGEAFPKIAESLSGFYERYLEGDKMLFSELRS